MNAHLSIRSGQDRRRNTILFPEEVRRLGSERRDHGRSESDVYATLWAITKSVCSRMLGASSH